MSLSPQGPSNPPGTGTPFEGALNRAGIHATQLHGRIDSLCDRLDRFLIPHALNAGSAKTVAASDAPARQQSAEVVEYIHDHATSLENAVERLQDILERLAI